MKKDSPTETGENSQRALIDQISSNHRAPFFLFLFFLLGCFIYGVQVRKGQLNVWQENKQAFYANGQPLMTTLDAPYYVNHAKNYRLGTEKRKRGFPVGRIEQKMLQLDIYQRRLASADVKIVQEALARGEIKKAADFVPHYEKKIKDIKRRINEQATLESNPKKPEVPALSFIIAKLSPWFNNQDYLAGTYLVIVGASLFMIPLGLYFWYLGVPLAGILGGLIGNFSLMYFMRSSVGRIDTDIMNLFFPFLIALFIFLIGKAEKLSHQLAFSALAGLSSLTFMWVYPKPAFIFAFFLSLIAYLLFQKNTRRWQILVPCALVFLTLNIKYASQFTYSAKEFIMGNIVQTKALEKNTKTSALASPVIFPNTMKTISEAQKSVSIEETLKYTLNNQFLSYLGLLSFLAMVILYWKEMIPLAPLIFLAGFSFTGSNRMIMFLGPFIGIGLGYLLTLILRQIRQYTRLNVELRFSDPKLETQKNFFWTGITLVVSIFSYTLMQGYTHVKFIPRPSIPPYVMNNFREIKKIVPENSALMTWWDFGYALIEQTNLSVFHDGGDQFSPKTHFIANSLISSDQKKLFNMTKFLATQGNWGVKQNKISPAHLSKAMQNSPYNAFNPVYLLFTFDMVSKYSAISSLGNWDLATGKQKGVSGV